MTTRADLRTIIRNQGLDETTWSDTEVNQWIADAIAEYSNHFPRYRESTANACTAGTKEYTLPTDFLSALRVEYPEGEDPPEYLSRLSEEDARFGENYYDIRGTTLVLGEDPSAGETYALHYYAHHDYPDADEDVLTVPDEDLEILVLHVLWKAYRRLELDEAKNPDGSTVVLSMLSSSTMRVRREYDKAIRKRRRAEGVSTPPWG